MTIRCVALGLGIALLGGCKDAVVPNLNDPTIDVPIKTRAEVQSQVSGLLAGDREFHAFQILILETMGRDAYRIDPADPRYVQQPLGLFSPGAFIVDFLWTSNYRTIRGAQLLTQGVDASSVVSTQEKAAARGFARTVEALEYLRLIEERDTLGLPINLGTGSKDPVRCKPAVLQYISSLLDSAAADLGGAGASFPFALPSGFAGFDTPATFLKFNRGLAAKVMTYRGFRDYSRTGAIDAAALTAALALLDQSFENHTDPTKLRVGVYHAYSTASGDLTNGNFDNSVYRVNPKVAADTEPGDRRNAKFVRDPRGLTTDPSGNASSDLLFAIVQSPTTPLPVLINEELVLIRAEVLWGLGRYAEALALMNFIRTNSGGLLPKTAASFNGFATAADQLNLLRAILREKRFSLLWESGARVVDFRMFGLFPELGNEKPNPGKEPRVIPFPQAEIDARGGQLTCQQ